MKILFTILTCMDAAKYSNRDIRNGFSAINDTLTRLYSSGSVELQLGRYVIEKDLVSLEEKFRNYSFVS